MNKFVQVRRVKVALKSGEHVNKKQKKFLPVQS
jgi:hypothetical protein